MSNICTSEISSFLVDNIEWLFPLFVTILLTVISLRNEQRQKQLAEYEVGISLMEKRLAFFEKERVVLETIMDKKQPSQAEITELRHAEHETLFLFGQEVKDHIDKALNLIDEFQTYKPEIIPNGLGGAIIIDKDADVYVERAVELFDEAISIYKLYIDFSSIGLAHAKERQKRYAKTKKQK